MTQPSPLQQMLTDFEQAATNRKQHDLYHAFCDLNDQRRALNMRWIRLFGDPDATIEPPTVPLDPAQLRSDTEEFQLMVNLQLALVQAQDTVWSRPNVLTPLFVESKVVDVCSLHDETHVAVRESTATQARTVVLGKMCPLGHVTELPWTLAPLDQASTLALYRAVFAAHNIPLLFLVKK